MSLLAVSSSHRNSPSMSQALKAWRIKASNVLEPARFLPLGKDCSASLRLVLPYLPLTVDSLPADSGLLVHTNY